jgi:spore germination protein YaaH
MKSQRMSKGNLWQNSQNWQHLQNWQKHGSLLQFIAVFAYNYHLGNWLGSTPRALANLIRVERFGFFILPER